MVPAGMCVGILQADRGCTVVNREEMGLFFSLVNSCDVEKIRAEPTLVPNGSLIIEGSGEQNKQNWLFSLQLK